MFGTKLHIPGQKSKELRIFLTSESDSSQCSEINHWIDNSAVSGFVSITQAVSAPVGVGFNSQSSQNSQLSQNSQSSQSSQPSQNSQPSQPSQSSQLSQNSQSSQSSPKGRGGCQAAIITKKNCNSRLKALILQQCFK